MYHNRRKLVFNMCIDNLLDIVNILYPAMAVIIKHQVKFSCPIRIFMTGNFYPCISSAFNVDSDINIDPFTDSLCQYMLLFIIIMNTSACYHQHIEWVATLGCFRLIRCQGQCDCKYGEDC
jgi:hypothetical protein